MPPPIHRSPHARFDIKATEATDRFGAPLRARSRCLFLKQSPRCSLLGKLHHEGRHLFFISSLKKHARVHERAMGRRDRKPMDDDK